MTTATNTILTTGCKALDWMISKATEYTTSDIDIVYRFRGNVPFRMRDEALAWGKQHGTQLDGRSRSGYTVQIEEDIDVAGRWYHATRLHITHGCYHSTVNDVEVMITVEDFVLSDEDIAEITANN